MIHILPPNRLMILVVLSTLLSSPSLPISTIFANAATSDNEEIRCVTQWGVAPSDATKMTVIPTAQINDGYCDCLDSGLDEPNTSACAGLSFATTGTKEIMFQCPQQPTLQLHLSRINDGICDCCEGADEMKVAADGTTTNHCEDRCASVLAAFRAEQKQRQLQFKKGHEVRSKMITSYQTMINTTRTKIKQLTHDITERSNKLETKYTVPLSMKQMQYATLHTTRIFQVLYSLTGMSHDKDRFTKNALTFLHDLTRSELEVLIVNTCQLAGEIMSVLSSANDNDDVQQSQAQKTCVPLRLAAIEAGDLYVTSTSNDAPPTIELRRSSQGEKESDHLKFVSLILADMYDYNSKHPNHPIFMEEDYNSYKKQLDSGIMATSSHKPKRSPDNDEDEDYEEYEHDEYEHDSQDEADATSVFVPRTVYEDTMTFDEHAKFQKMVQESKLSKSRQIYLQRTMTLEQHIQEEIKKMEKEQQQPGKKQEEEELVLADEIYEEPAVDHSDEIQRLKEILEQLRSRVTHIEQGYHYGISAHKLLSLITEESMTFRSDPEFIFGAAEKNMQPSVNDVPLFHHQYLQKLFMLTLYYSQLSVRQLNEILVLSVSPPSAASDAEQSGDEQQCTLPHSSLCPPRSTLRESVSVPKFIYDEMEAFCNTLSMDGTDGSGSAETSTCAAVDVIPESVPDGFFGYYMVMPRDENDAVSKLLIQVGTDATYCTDDEIRTRREMREIQETVTQYHINLRSMENTLQEMKESIQSTDGLDRIDSSDEEEDEDDDHNIVLPKYGLDGELHSIQDQCFDFTQGKYKYEICLYQGSLQKDIESTDTGTSLGRWAGAHMERVVENNVEYYERIWKWENGAQCWNGPQRSITAHVNRCGPITKIISANEPDTCRYVVEVESPIACDTAYQQRYGLE